MLGRTQPRPATPPAVQALLDQQYQILMRPLYLRVTACRRDGDQQRQDDYLDLIAEMTRSLRNGGRHA